MRPSSGATMPRCDLHWCAFLSWGVKNGWIFQLGRQFRTPPLGTCKMEADCCPKSQKAVLAFLATGMIQPIPPPASVEPSVITGGGQKDNRKVESRSDIVTFTSPAMQEAVTIDLLSTAHCFQVGHRIRLQVSSGAPGYGNKTSDC